MPVYHHQRTASPAAYAHTPRSSSSSFSRLSESPPKSVLFAADPISSISRPLTSTEQWPLYNFEMHARSCRSCNDPLSAHRAHRRLCGQGHELAVDVASLIYSRADGMDVMAVSDAARDGQVVCVELPRNYPQTRSLLRAVERSQRRTRQAPIVSFDSSYYVAPRTSGLLRPETPVDSSPRRSALRHAGTLDASPSGSLRRSGSASVRRSRDIERVPMPELSHSPSPPRRRTSTARRRTSVAMDEPRVESLNKGLASLAVRSQTEDLSDATLQEPLAASSKSSHRRSVHEGSYETSVRLPPQKRMPRGRNSMAL